MMVAPLEIVVANSSDRSARAQAMSLPAERRWTADAGEKFDDFRRRVKIAAVGATFLLWEMPVDK